jgi:hypothetical protein
MIGTSTTYILKVLGRTEIESEIIKHQALQIFICGHIDPHVFHTKELQQYPVYIVFNSLTAIRVPAGTKNSRPVEFVQ